VVICGSNELCSIPICGSNELCSSPMWLSVVVMSCVVALSVVVMSCVVALSDYLIDQQRLCLSLLIEFSHLGIVFSISLLVRFVILNIYIYIYVCLTNSIESDFPKLFTF
jgi:hypothetical protein